VRRTLAAVALLAALALPTKAQVAWEAPAFLSPAAPAGVSVFLVDAAGGGLGGLVTFRHSAGPVGLGYRFGLFDDEGVNDGIAIGGGFDVSGFLSRGVEGSEVDLMWWSGGGLGIGDETLVTIPLGLILGWTGSGEDVTLSPYGGGHMALAISSVDNNSVDLIGVVDLGLDLTFPSGWLVRFGASVGDEESLALGVRLPT